MKLKTADLRYKNILSDLLICLTIIAMAWAMKSFYSQADSSDLDWILTPTAMLAEQVSGIEFESENGAGYLSREQRVLIAPACAGVNFLIISFCMTAFQGIFRFEKNSGKIVWTVFTALSAYIVTICVNTVRIILSVYLYRADIYSGSWSDMLTPERLHRIGGTAVYFLFLYLLFLTVSKILEKREGEKNGEKNTSPLRNLWPLFCYLSVSLGIPLLNAARQNNRQQFSEHALSVLSVSLGIILVFILIQWGYNKFLLHRSSLSE